MSSNEEVLMTLYTRRQGLLKQLGEVNNEIRTLEQKIRESANHSEVSKLEESPAECVDEGDGINLLFDCCLRDTNGLREAVRYADTLKGLKDCPCDSENDREKHLRRNRFVHEMIARSCELMLDANGSELVQHALEMLKSGGKVSPELHSTHYIVSEDNDLSEILLLLRAVSGKVEEICCDTNGCRVMQKIFDCLKTLEELEFSAQCFSDHIIALCKDVNGNHTVSRLLAAVRSANYWNSSDTDEASMQKLKRIHQVLYEKFPEHCMDVCKNRQGCCIIQKCLQWAPEPYFSAVMNTIVTNTLKLVHDPFGNYVIQFILDHEREFAQRDPAAAGNESPGYTNQIIRQMLHNVAALSCNKFCSNVIEKCLKNATPEVRQLLVDELTDPQVLPKLLTDSFANYVIQTAIVTSSEEKQFTQLRDSIMPLQKMLKNSPHGVKVEAKLVRRQREIARKNGNHKNQRRWNPPVVQLVQEEVPESFISAQLVSSVPGIPRLVGPEDFGGHALALQGVAKDATPIVTSTQYMPFMLQGQQALFGLPQGYPQQQFQVDIMKDGGLWDPRQGFTVVPHPGSKRGVQQ
uniref:Putative pumillo RNA binding protein PUF1 n=1 Tax=Trypanosoma congolense (strain IL3000) TaxID=1068625 RepID=G0UW36_TRYCI|nr:putative pumillo RNA binding protein PUF1 [Trypanosoma congolense IL3000]